jgi:Flp pilus assembly protein TadD
MIGLGWALCRAGKQQEALPWLERAVANAPKNYSVLNDYGWGLAELGRFDEAQKALEKAVQLAPAAYDLPAKNLKRLQQLRENAQPRKGTRQIQ